MPAYPSPPSTPSPSQSTSSLRGTIVVQRSPPSQLPHTVPSFGTPITFQTALDTTSKSKKGVSRAQPIEDPNIPPNTVKSFVEVGSPIGGNPHGGPEFNKSGYVRIEKKVSNGRFNVVHNMGVWSTEPLGGDVGEKGELGPGNDETHVPNCRKESRRTKHAVCICPT